MKKLLILLLLTISLPAISQHFCKSSITASTPDSRFMVSGQEVADMQTGLIWQKCSLGQSGSDCLIGSAQRYEWSEALQAAATLRQQTGQTWRLPNIKELQSIVEYRCFDPAINVNIFPNTLSADYLSASANTGTPWHDGPRTVYFLHGNVFGGSFVSYYVRLVRTGQ